LCRCRPQCHEEIRKEILGIIDAKFKEWKEYVDKRVEDLRKFTLGNQGLTEGKKEKKKRKKFVIYGIPESGSESAKDLERKVSAILRKDMEISAEVVNDMISGTNRMGKQKEEPKENESGPKRRPRPVVLELLREKHRPVFIGQLRHLRGTGLRVESYLTIEERRDKNLLLEHRKRAKEQELKVKMVGDEMLLVENVPHIVKNGKVIPIVKDGRKCPIKDCDDDDPPTPLGKEEELIAEELNKSLLEIRKTMDRNAQLLNVSFSKISNELCSSASATSDEEI